MTTPIDLHCLYCGRTANLTTDLNAAQTVAYVWCQTCQRPSFVTLVESAPERRASNRSLSAFASAHAD